MMVAGVNGQNMQARPIARQGADSVSRDLQRQISELQKELQELSAKDEMPVEEKMKKRKDIQQQIGELNAQLQQHEAEVRRERQEAKETPRADESGAGNGKGTGLSGAGMEAMISADASLKQARAAGSAATKAEGGARILESEIRRDEAMGKTAEKKREELADARKTAQRARNAQAGTLGDAGRKLRESAKTAPQEPARETEDKDKDEEQAREQARERQSENAHMDVRL